MPYRKPKLSGKSGKPLIVTIDGPAGSGKSTVAKLLAQKLGLTYLDTGATYRALAWAVLQQHPSDIASAGKLAVMAGCMPVRLVVGHKGAVKVFFDGVEITKAIRTQEVSEAAAQVSQYPEVRAAMVVRQRELAKRGGVVVEGRDTGSVVFPDAQHKFFLDAELATRAKRRQRELMKLYREPTPLAQIRDELHFRDNLDRYRVVGPLIQPKGAVVIDTTRLSAKEVVDSMLRRINSRSYD